MTDTETRLRDYLQTQASTVPDSTQGPGLDEPGSPHRRRWPVILAAAAIAAILVLAASFLTRQSDPPTAPPGPVSGAAPQVPYTVSTKRVVTLHDGTRQVRVPFVFGGFFFGRVGGGWLTVNSSDRVSQVGLLMPDGSFRPIGPRGGQSAFPSPDGSQVALVARRADQKGRVLVIDVRSGREVATTPVQARVPLLLGWNKNGIWMSHDEAKVPELLVWRPESGQPQPVAVPRFDGARAIPGTAGNIVLSTRDGNKRCLKAGVVDGATFAVQREYCDEGVAQLYPVLSPDGRTMIQSEQKVAVDLATGKVTKLQLPDRVVDWPEPVFEDATQLLALTEPDNVMGEIPRELYRCDVTTGACKLLVKKAADIALQMP